MVRTEKIIINDKEYFIKCSIATAEAYERATGNKFSKILSSTIKQKQLLDNADGNTEDLIDFVLDLQINVIKLSYFMILEAKKDGLNKDFNMTLDDYLSSISSLPNKTMKEVLAVASGLFRGQVQNRTTDQEEQYQ